MSSKWGWYNVIFGLCNDDILNIDKVTKVEFYTALTYMCYQQDKYSEQKSNFNKHKK
jgi:hypothetical protein